MHVAAKEAAVVPPLSMHVCYVLRSCENGTTLAMSPCSNMLLYRSTHIGSIFQYHQSFVISKGYNYLGIRRTSPLCSIFPDNVL